MSCHVSPRMLAGRPWIMSVAPMLTTCKPPASAASRAMLRFSFDLYRLRGSSSVGVLISASASGAGGGGAFVGSKGVGARLSLFSCDVYTKEGKQGQHHPGVPQGHVEDTTIHNCISHGFTRGASLFGRA